MNINPANMVLPTNINEFTAADLSSHHINLLQYFMLVSFPFCHP